MKNNPDSLVQPTAGTTDAVGMRGPEQRAVKEWFASNGGRADIRAAVKRALEEFKELLEAIEAGDIEHAREESADVALALMMVAEYGGFDLLEAVRWKQAINNARRWRVDESGCLHHIKGTDPRDSPGSRVSEPSSETGSTQKGKGDVVG